MKTHKRQQRNLWAKAIMISLLGAVCFAFLLLAVIRRVETPEQAEAQTAPANTDRSKPFWFASAGHNMGQPQPAAAEAGQAGRTALPSPDNIQVSESAISRFETAARTLQHDLDVLHAKLRMNYRKTELLEQEANSGQVYQQMLRAELDAISAAIATKEAELARLRREVEEALGRSASPARQAENEVQKQHYFITGTTRELRDCGILERDGRLLTRVGLKQELAAEQENSDFVPITTDEREIPVQGKKVRIMSGHPENSYAWITDEQGAVTHLQIREPESFWAESPYLVLLVN